MKKLKKFANAGESKTLHQKKKKNYINCEQQYGQQEKRKTKIQNFDL